MATPLLLASTSPRRIDLLTRAGIPHTVTPAEVDEQPRPGEAPIPFARRMAETKGRKVAAARGVGGVVLAADTIVWTSPKTRPLGKPRDRDDALRMLLELTGRDDPHFVTTAVCFADDRGDGDVPHFDTFHETTRVWMRTPPRAEIEAYLDTDEWKDKAGAYGIQGRALAFVRKIDGSYSNVVGLPLAQVIDRLYELGILTP